MDHTSLIPFLELLVPGLLFVLVSPKFPTLDPDRWKAIQLAFPPEPIAPDAKRFRGLEFQLGGSNPFWSSTRMRWGWFEAALDGQCLHLIPTKATAEIRSIGYLSFRLADLEAPHFDGESTCWYGANRIELNLEQRDLVKALRQINQPSALQTHAI